MANSSTTNGGTVLTVPPNSNWIGCIQLSATLRVAIGGSAATATPTITVSGSGGNMTDGDTAVGVALAVSAVAALSLIGSQATDSAMVGPLNIQSRANPVQLILNFPAGVTAIGTAFGAVQ